MSKNNPKSTARPGLAFLSSQGWPTLQDAQGKQIAWHQTRARNEIATTSWDLEYNRDDRLFIAEATPVSSPKVVSRGREGWPPGSVLRIKGQLAVVVMIHWLMYPVIEIFGFLTANPIAARGALWAAVAGAARLETLILGPSGTGKERIAHIAYQSFCLAHGKGPFISINAGALTQSLFASELFGFERGAYTGAEKAGPGAFRSAHRGVLFMDEIGDAHENAQIAMLRAIENQEVRPLGGRNNQSIEVMTIAATNKPLSHGGEVQGLRKDLRYRLSGVTINMPSLSDRKEDILPLAKHFIAQMGLEPRICARSISTLLNYEWHGNIRELRRTLQRVVVLTGEGTINHESLRASLPQNSAQQDERAPENIEPIDAEILRIGDLPKSERRRGWLQLGLSKSTYYRRLGRLRNSEQTRKALKRYAT